MDGIVKILCQLILLFIVSCGSVAAGEQQLKIGMLLWRGETRAEIGFREGLQELGYLVDYEVFDSAQDLKKLGTHLHVINKNIEQFDYIYTFGTTASRRAKVVIGARVPQLFNIVTDPVQAGIVTSLTSPGLNISGASDAIKIADQLGSAMQLFRFEKLGFFFNPREKNSMIIRNELHQFGDNNGFDVVDFRSPPAKESLLKNLQQLVDNPGLVDAVYLSADSYLVSEAELIGSLLRRAKVKSIGPVRSFIEHGVLMGVVGDYYQLGRSVSDIVDRHQKGEELGTIPVEHIHEVRLIINRQTAELVDLKVSGVVNDEAILLD